MTVIGQADFVKGNKRSIEKIILRQELKNIDDQWERDQKKYFVYLNGENILPTKNTAINFLSQGLISAVLLALIGFFIYRSVPMGDIVIILHVIIAIFLAVIIIGKSLHINSKSKNHSEAELLYLKKRRKVIAQIKELDSN